MKVTVVSRSGREVVKGGIDLKDSVRCAPARPPRIDFLRGLGFSAVREVSILRSGFEISCPGLSLD